MAFVCKPLDVYEINENLLERLAKDDTSDTVKVFNLLKSIQNMIDKQGHLAPYLHTIGERAEAIVQAFQMRQKATQDALAALEGLIREINQAEQERVEKNLKPASFAVYWLLNQEGVHSAEEIAHEMEKTFSEYPHFRVSAAQERDVRVALYRVLLKDLVKAEKESGGTKETNELTLLVEQIMRVAGRAGEAA